MGITLVLTLVVVAGLFAGVLASLNNPSGGAGVVVDLPPGTGRVPGLAEQTTLVASVEAPAGETLLGRPTVAPLSGDRRAAADVDLEPAPTYELHITVVDDVGHPVPGAQLQVTDPTGFTSPLMATDGQIILTTTRTTEHVFLVDGPVKATREERGYARHEGRWTPDPHQEVAQREVVLPREARIVGSLYCTDGSSPGSAGIDIFHIERADWSNAAALEDGTFTSSWMPPGEVIVYSRNGSWSDTDLRERQKMTLFCGQSLLYRGALAPAIDLKGTVVDTAGRPLANVSVDIYDADNAAYTESVISGKNGQFLCDGLYPGGYLLDLPAGDRTPKTFFTVERGQASRTMGNLVLR